jgi:hypothetical protein
LSFVSKLFLGPQSKGFKHKNIRVKKKKEKRKSGRRRRTPSGG